MMKFKQSDAAGAELDWPEPLVIDIVSERFADIPERDERMALARLQSLALREAYAGRDRRAAAARIDLIAFCAARGIPAERIARVDLAVFHELSQITTTRFRNSPRLRSEIGSKLAAALQMVRSAPSGAAAATPKHETARASPLPAIG